MKQVKVVDVLREGVVFFMDWDAMKAFPIFMKQEQVNAIAISLKGVDVGRPLTFQFFAQLLKQMKPEIDWVCISELKETTFYAKVHLKNGAEVDARPSDAVNLAIVIGVPIYAEEALIDRIGIQIDVGQANKSDLESKGMDTLIEELRSQVAVKMRNEGIASYVQSLFKPNS